MWRVGHLGLYPWLLLALLSQSPEVLIRQASEDLKAGRYRRAEEEISCALKAEPRNWNLWYYLGVTRVQLREPGLAIEAFEKARLLAPQEAPAYFGLGLLYMQKGDVDKALEAYRGGLARDPNDIAASQNYALLLMGKGDFREAVEPLLRLKRLSGGDVSTRATLIEAYLKGGMKAEGESEIDQLLMAHLATKQEELSLAKLLVADRERQAAEEILRHAVVTWPDWAESHGELGLLLIQEENYERAVNELGRAVQLDPQSAKYSLGLGEALLRWRHDPVALQYLLAIREEFGELPIYKFQLGLAYFYLTRFPMAIQQFESLAREKPKSSRVQLFLGDSYQAMGDLRKAEDCYRKAIALNPEEAPYYTALASLLKKENPADLAEPGRLLGKALALSPTDQEVKLLLASCFELEGKLAEAQALLEEVIRRSPGSRNAHAALAQVYYRQKRVEDAQEQKSIASKLEADKLKEISPWGPGEVGGP
jgi:tetratricopeptide (TPR) repeat protein